MPKAMQAVWTLIRVNIREGPTHLPMLMRANKVLVNKIFNAKRKCETQPYFKLDSKQFKNHTLGRHR